MATIPVGAGADKLPCLPPPENRPEAQDGIPDPYTCTSYVAAVAM